MYFKSKDHNVQELIKGTSSALFLKLFGMFCTYAAMVFITRNFGAEEWGIFTIGLTLLNIAVVVPVFGFDNSLVRMITEIRLSGDKKQIGSILLRAIATSIVFSAFIILLINYFSDLVAQNILKNEKLVYLIQLTSLILIPQVLLKLFGGFFQSFKRTIEFMLFKSVLVSAVFLLLLVGFYVLDYNPGVFKTYVIAIGISVVIAIIVFMVFYSSLKQGELQSNSLFGLKKMINISYPMLLASSFGLIMGWADILMLTYYKTAVDVGIFNTALKLAAIALFTLAAVNSIASPKFAEFYATKDFDGLKNVVQKSTKLMFYVTAPLLLILLIFPKTILSIFGEEFVTGYVALIVLCIARFINAISGSVGFLMQMTDNQKIYQNVMLIALAVNIILNALLIPKYGITGVAFASGIAMVLWNIILVITIKRKLGFWTIYIPFLVK